MAEILVLGAGLNGLVTAMLLARDGHSVTILERDEAPPGDDAGKVWLEWQRPGVNQFRQLHYMLPRWRTLMQRELPAVLEQLIAFGGSRVNVFDQAARHRDRRPARRRRAVRDGDRPAPGPGGGSRNRRAADPGCLDPPRRQGHRIAHRAGHHRSGTTRDRCA